MDSSPALPHPIQQALARGWTILTANQRAARTLRHAYDRHQQALGLTHWQPPAILAWESWTAALWHRLLLDGHATTLLLNSTQEEALWRAIIDRHSDQRPEQPTPDATTHSPSDSLAELAASAWSLLHAYRGRHRLQSSIVSTDTRAFARWAAEFDRRCTRHDYLTQAQLPEALRAAITSGSLTLTIPDPGQPSPGILLVGFDTKTPAQTALLEAASATGITLEDWSPQASATPSTLVEAPGPPEELEACAHWLRARLTQHPRCQLAVIVPDLDASRTTIDRTLRHILAPELEDITAPASAGPFEFSLGVPLASTPIVATALEILRWTISSLPLDRITALLLSPHFAVSPSGPGSAAEPTARAEFDAFTLRRQHLLQPQLSLDAIIPIAVHSRRADTLPILLRHLRTLRLLVHRTDFTASRTHAEWASVVHDLLDAAGWASSGNESGVQFQTRRKWESALDELSTLDFDPDTSRIPFATALTSLQRIAKQTLFAPESRHAPIQIMGPLEAAGSTFDAIWFLNAGDLTWPASPVPNPLLPWHLQRELGMPGVDTALDTAHARRITARIAASAPTVLFSYAAVTPDGHQRPSPSLAPLTLEPRAAALIAPTSPTPITISLEAAADSEAAPIPPPTGRLLQGGASVLQAQAACGFRAFAERRLFAAPLEDRDLGLDPRERGTLVHVVLEHLWAEVQTQANLAALTESARDFQLAASIDHALTRHTAAAASGWNRAYLDTERRRLLNLLRPWLAFELERSPFAVKSREETLRGVGIGPLHLDVRVDRIDLPLIDGEPAGELILDYKTGIAKTADWMGDRPDAPQLPLYAVLSAAPHLAGIAFASVRAGTGMEITGYEAFKGVLPKAARLKAPSLDAQVNEWRTTLTSLAEDFYNGVAPASPKQYPSTCRNCGQRILCRLDLASLEADAIEELIDENDPDPSETAKETPLG